MSRRYRLIFLMHRGVLGMYLKRGWRGSKSPFSIFRRNALPTTSREMKSLLFD